MNKLILNLSFRSHPNDCVAAMVVSEIIDKLSPSMDPPNKAPEINGKEAPLLSASETAIGPIATIAPTEVPVAVDKNEAIKNIPNGK